MAYISDWTRAGGWWKVKTVSTGNPWGLVAKPDNPDRLKFEGTGGGISGTDIVKRKRDNTISPVGDECSHSVVTANVKEVVRVEFSGDPYIVTLDMNKKELTCRPDDGTGSGNVSWTAVDG